MESEKFSRIDKLIETGIEIFNEAPLLNSTNRILERPNDHQLSKEREFLRWETSCKNFIRFFFGSRNEKSAT